jgi:hypothetical protein
MEFSVGLTTYCNFLYFGFIMKHILLLFISCLFYIAASAQDPAIPVSLLSNTKKGPERYIGTDAFDWEYTISDSEFRKAKGDKILKYRNLSFGEIYKADIQNPLQIVLFYRRFNTVVLLDNQLNEIRRINFSETPQQLIVEAASLASQNRLWIYDITTQQIGLYSLTQNNFKTLTPPFTDNLKFYQSDYNYFYWVDSVNKCFVVNLFGNVSFLGTIPSYQQLQILSYKEALLKKDDLLYHYNMETGSLRKIEMVEKSFTSFNYASQILTIFTEEEINKYKVILPQ